VAARTGTAARDRLPLSRSRRGRRGVK